MTRDTSRLPRLRPAIPVLLLAAALFVACAGRQPSPTDPRIPRDYLGLLASAPGAPLTFRPCIPAHYDSSLPSIWMVEGGRELLEALLERRAIAPPFTDLRGVLAGLARVRGHVPEGVRPGYPPVSSHIILRDVLEVRWSEDRCPAVLPPGVVGAAPPDPGPPGRQNP